MSESKTSDPMVAALLRERESYVRRGLKNRVQAVDEQLALRGFTDVPEDVPEQVDSEPAPRGRRAPSKRTAAESNGKE
jgi:hypothetical protein